MTNSPLVSIITPAYNEGNNINNCYMNLMKQTVNDFEWIIINDGSTDNTADVVNDIISNHQSNLFKIRYFEQENKGAAEARKLGINKSKTEYILTLDSDDYLSNDTIQKAFSKIINSDIDIVTFDLKYVKNNIVYKDFKFKVDKWPIEGERAFKCCIDGWGLHGLFLAKKKIWLSTYSEISSNNNVNDDELISRFVMLKAKKIDICNGCYYYVYNNMSTTNKVNDKYYKIAFSSISLAFFVYEEFELDIKVKNLAIQHVYKTYVRILKRFLRYFFKYHNKKDWVNSLGGLLEVHKKLALENEKYNHYIKERFFICSSFLILRYLKIKAFQLIREL